MKKTVLVAVIVFILLFAAACAMGETFEAYGLTLSEDQKTLDLGKTKIEDFEEFVEVLKKMPSLESVSMFNTRMEKETMELLHETFPNIRFGWTMRAAKYRIRTDAEAFSTIRNPDDKPRYGTSTYETIRYCWQLHALDLGHNSIEDISFVSGLTDLHYLILADNRITDISALSSLKELEYLELFMNDITDITPLLDLPNLIDLNLSRTRIEDLTPLYEMKQLKRLWISRVKTGISEEEKEALMAALPNTEICITANCTSGGWRQHPRFYKIKNSLYKSEQKYIPFTDEERGL